MRKFLTSIFLFIIPFFIYIIFAINILPYLLEKVNGPDTEKQLRVSFNNVLQNDFDLLLLGNSRVYRGVNPDKLSVSSYNFSHDNDGFNQLYFKLKYLEKRNISYKYLVIGIDYFQFSTFSDTRNYIYGELFGQRYLDDYQSNLFSSKLAHYSMVSNPKILLYLKPKKTIPFIKKNGQYIRDIGKASLDDKVKRDITKSPLQIKYFNKIIEYCNKNSIKLFFVMLPLRQNELDSYSQSEIINFDNFIKKRNIIYWNFSLDTLYNLEDYTDITHLNSKASDRFSLQLNDSIKRYLHPNK